MQSVILELRPVWLAIVTSRLRALPPKPPPSRGSLPFRLEVGGQKEKHRPENISKGTSELDRRAAHAKIDMLNGAATQQERHSR